MNWVIYCSINLAKILAIGGLFLLSAFALPIMAIIFALGFSLSFLRDVETRFLTDKQLTSNFPNIKLDYLLLWPAKITRIQHAWIQRDRSKF